MGHRRMRYDPIINSVVPIDIFGDNIQTGEYGLGPIMFGNDDDRALSTLIDYLLSGAEIDDGWVDDDEDGLDTDSDDDYQPAIPYLQLHPVAINLDDTDDSEGDD